MGVKTRPNKSTSSIWVDGLTGRKISTLKAAGHVKGSNRGTAAVTVSVVVPGPSSIALRPFALPLRHGDCVKLPIHAAISMHWGR